MGRMIGSAAGLLGVSLAVAGSPCSALAAETKDASSQTEAPPPKAEGAESQKDSEAEAPAEGAPNPEAAPAGVAEPAKKGSQAAGATERKGNPKGEKAESDPNASAESSEGLEGPAPAPAASVPSAESVVPPGGTDAAGAVGAGAGSVSSVKSAASAPTGVESVAVTSPGVEAVAASAPSPQQTAGAGPAVSAPPALAAASAPGGDPRVDSKGKDSKDHEDDLPPGTAPQPGGLSISVGGQLAVGQSSFVVEGYARNPMVSWSGLLGVNYRLPSQVRLRVGTSVSQELTLSDGADDPQTLLLGNTNVSVGKSLFNFEDGPRINGSLSATLPTSKASRVATLWTTLSAGLSAIQPLGPVIVTAGTRFRKNFHRYTHPLRQADGGTFTTEDGVTRPVGTGNARAPRPTGELVDPLLGLTGLNGNLQIDGDTLVNAEANNTSMGWSNFVGLFYPLPSGVGLSVGYNLSHSWTYESFELDDFSGVGAAAGRGRRDSHGGSVSAFYQLDNLSMSAGMATGGPTRSSDDKRIRFPFFNFDGPESNRTTFFLGLTVTESIPL